MNRAGLPQDLPQIRGSFWEARFKLLPGKHKKHSDQPINQKTIKVKKSMFRKHQGSELNQHIRVIQRLVPGRQHFIHNPIHPSSSISPRVGPHSTEWSGTFASCNPCFWLVLTLDWTLARVYTQMQIQLICHPPSFAPCLSSFHRTSVVHTHFPYFFFCFYPKSSRMCPRNSSLGSFYRESGRTHTHCTFFSFLAYPWGNNLRTSSLDDAKPFNALRVGLIVEFKEGFAVWAKEIYRAASMDDLPAG